jgi:hypothetical protein
MSRKYISQPEGIEADIEQISSALSKIRDPMSRYFFAMLAELMAERVAELSEIAESRRRAIPRAASIAKSARKSGLKLTARAEPKSA